MLVPPVRPPVAILKDMIFHAAMTKEECLIATCDNFSISQVSSQNGVMLFYLRISKDMYAAMTTTMTTRSSLSMT